MDFGENQARFDRCRDLLDEKRYGEAYVIAGELYVEEPDDPAVVALFCDAAVASENAAQAVRAGQRYTKKYGWDAEVLEYLAGAQWTLHLYEPCRRTCRLILEREAENEVALDYGLATTLELGDFEAAEDIIDLASRAARHPDVDDHLKYQTAVTRMMRGPDQWARGVFEEFLAADPKEPGTYINLMRIHHLEENYGEVERLFRQATDHGLSHEDLEFNMGLALKAQERDREAARYFIRAVRRNANLPDAHFHLGQILRNEGHLKAALWMLQRELSVDDTHPAVHAEMAWCAEDLLEFDAAVRMIRAAVERAPDWAIYQHSCAELLMKANSGQDEEAAALALEEAEVIANRAVKLDATYAAGWQVLGRLAAERDDFKEAKRCLEMAMDAADATAEDKGWYGLILAELGDDAGAVPMLKAAARVHPSWPAVAEMLGELRGRPLPTRFEVRFEGHDEHGRTWYRVLHVVARDEAEARAAALDPKSPGDRVADLDIRGLGYDVDHEPGIVWDSGTTDRRYPTPPPPSDVID